MMSEKMNVNKIRLIEPLEYRIEMISGPYCSSKFLHPKYTRVVGCCSSSLIMSIRWVLDPEDEAHTALNTQIRFPANHWRSEELKVLAPYFYIQIAKPEGSASVINEKLIIEFFNIKGGGGERETEQKQEPKEEQKEEDAEGEEDERIKKDEERRKLIEERRVSIEEPRAPCVPSYTFKACEGEQRGKSPFKSRIFGKKSSDSSPKGTMVDYRMPDFIHQDVILIGGKNGRVRPLPKGLPGQTLKIGEGGSVEWC
jgi:hypothetical protein